MFKKIMVPVDLAHPKTLKRALGIAAEMGKLYDAEVCYVGVTSNAPGSLGHNVKEFEQKLDEFTREQTEAHGHNASFHAYPSHDPAIDLTDTLLKAERDLGADMVVVASHDPNFTDHFWPSHGGQLAAKSKISVFVIR